MPQLEVRGFTVGKATQRLEIRDFVAVTGAAGARLEVRGFTVSGAAYGFAVSDVTPDSGQVVYLTFSGDPTVLVTWRVVSMVGVSSGGDYLDSYGDAYDVAGLPTITRNGNLGGFIKVPAVKVATDLVIGGQQGTATEKFATLTIQATPHGYYTSPGVWVPVYIEVYT